MSKADNLLSILWLLKSGRRLTAKQIAESLEIHVRTVYRYIDALCASGVPIVADSGHNGGYRLLRPLGDSPLFFDLEEQKALVHAAQFAREAGYPFEDALRRAVDKLKNYRNEDQQEAIHRHEAGFNVIRSLEDRTDETVLRLLELSVANGCAVEFDYTKAYGAEPEARQIDPYGLIHWKSKWYVIGHCRLRGDIRSFRTERIVRLAATARAFERPADFDARRYFLRNLLPSDLNDERTATVVIAGEPGALQSLCEHWQIAHGLLKRTDARIVCRVNRSSLERYLPYILLSYGVSVQVERPASLRRKLREIARQLHAHHGGDEID